MSRSASSGPGGIGAQGANWQSEVNRAAQALANEFVPGKGEITVTDSKRDRTGRPRYRVRRAVAAKDRSERVYIACRGGNLKAILEAVSEGVALAAHRIETGTARGPATDEMREAVKARWAEMLKANQKIAESAEAILLAGQKSKRTNFNVKIETLGHAFTVTRSAVSVIIEAGIFTERALAGMSVGGQTLQAFVQSQEKRAAKKQTTDN